jgi:hypothetical protein
MPSPLHRLCRILRYLYGRRRERRGDTSCRGQLSAGFYRHPPAASLQTGRGPTGDRGWQDLAACAGTRALILRTPAVCASGHGHRDGRCKSAFRSSSGSQKTFPSSLVQSLTAESCGSCLRRGQAHRHLAENLFVVSGYRSLHMNTSALYACFLRQSLELSLKKNFQLLRCQEGNGNSRGLPGPGLDPHAIWGFGRLRFWSHATHLFSGATKAAEKNLSILARPAQPG